MINQYFTIHQISPDDDLSWDLSCPLPDDLAEKLLLLGSRDSRAQEGRYHPQEITPRSHHSIQPMAGHGCFGAIISNIITFGDPLVLKKKVVHTAQNFAHIGV